MRMVADAVVVEPVSTSKFPANREKNREYCQIRSLCEIFNANPRANSIVCSKIPSATKQGNIFTEQGISTANAGIVSG